MSTFMHNHSIAEHVGGGMEARFYVDGVRVSRERVEHIKTRSHMVNGMSCFFTKGVEVAGGKTRRTNYSFAAY